MDLPGSVEGSYTRGDDNIKSLKMKRIFRLCEKSLASLERFLSMEVKYTLFHHTTYITFLAFVLVLQPVQKETMNMNGRHVIN